MKKLALLKVKRNMNKRFKILGYFLVDLFLVLFLSLFNVQILNRKKYEVALENMSVQYVQSLSAPRGRIYDRNHKLIVDNKPNKVIMYKKVSGISSAEEIKLAYEVLNALELENVNVSTDALKTFWLKQNPTLANEKITSAEWEKLKERKLSYDEIEKLKYARIDDEIAKMDETDKKAAYLFSLMNEGYSFDEKVIKSNASDKEYANFAENEYAGFYGTIKWEREYLYGDVFKTILGNVSEGIPAQNTKDYLAKGYKLNDRVGSSYLEYQYEDELKGEKDEYQILDGEKVLIKEGKRGNDIVLTIDIELQAAVEEIIIEELLKAKKEPNTEYFNRSFAVISDPRTGEILAMAGKQIINKDGSYEIYDYTPGVVTSPIVVGSVVKGASHIVGYNTGALKIGEVRPDTCLKIASTPLKCSWTYLGILNDITALKYSSNTYQYNTAIKVGGGVYRYDAPLVLNLDAFKTYRDTFAEFGLGVKTGIDLPVESDGFHGVSTDPSLLLAFAIGQYDTYTPMQLTQYINTIAMNGQRMKPFLVKEIYFPTKDGLTKLKKEVTPTLLNVVNTKPEYFARVKAGFLEVLKPGGTGYYTIDPIFEPAGKTGTSQSLIDTNFDGIVDKETISATFVAYAPASNPQVSFAVLSPDIYHYDNNSSFQTHVNARIAQKISYKYFSLYPLS